MEVLELTGQTRSHIRQVESPRFAAHPVVVDAFFKMKEAAKQDGIEIIPFSSFRDLRTQIRIWNHKFTGKKPLYSQQGKEIPYESLDIKKRIDAILGWSALPGASRHHWGTEIDVIDGAAMPEGYVVQLLPQEVEKGGIFYPLHCWLEANCQKFGFARPYDCYRGGIYPEPWHLSYVEISQNCLESLSLEILQQVVQDSKMIGKEYVLELLPEIFEKFVLNIASF